ncbi:S-adenosyl-L-methionine-dependent methyltransferase [Glarea lozoyensis ATCC 20868]|uniref:Protein-lysine N-methyltransferase EFM4 n=1 Tax=Glarea lozoyensis (strain ATCC 20868 / MF5171) TaxID=1116229 RepID=S3DK74_GLAL2|nr:S-adenosyl-L-methionine-dependent methyltransferase [Glarea lozoyensis ATCC 20868]EPE32461.1 S-adenosyl-L-methionine-dependent methyltransferase [Glarea lozoyensis ATCC 20868]
MANKPSHLEPSPLGTKEYWETLYTTELHNHTLDTTDEGTIWFADSAAEDKILPFLAEQILDKQILGPETGAENCSFLDLGTGNGHLLFRLRGVGEDEEDEEEVKWTGRMLGVDYSAKSVEFARKLAEQKGLDEKDIAFQHWDILSSPPEDILQAEQTEGWDVVLDKGTFDAISLSDEVDAQGRRVCEGYKGRVMELVRRGGLFLVTSCNWTPAELRGWFEGEGFGVVGEIAYRRFRFGGEEGQTIASVCFRREE